MATGETKLSYLDVVDDIQDGDTVPILRNGKNYMSTGLAQVNADLTDIDIMRETGTAIQSGGNLNDYLTPGKYYSQNASISGTLTNSPVTTAGFDLYVYKQVVAANTVFQMLTRTSTIATDIVFVRICSAGTWGNWLSLSGTSVSTTSLSNKPEDGDV